MGRIIAALSWPAPLIFGAGAFALGGPWAAAGGAITGFAFLVWANDWEVRALARKSTPDWHL